MWIVDPRVGLLSVVVAGDSATGEHSTDSVVIRARSRRHLRLLQDRCPSLAGAEIVRSGPERDYACRMTVPRSAWVAAMSVLAETLDAKNVKSSAHRYEAALGRDFVSAMHTVHATLARVKDAPPAAR